MPYFSSDPPAPFRPTDYLEAARLPRITISEELVLDYSVSAVEFIGEAEVDPDLASGMLRRRKCTAWMLRRGECVGGIVLKRFTVPPMMTNEELLELMDRDSGSAYELACALASQFSDIGDEVGCYGDILELSQVWHSGHLQSAHTGPDIARHLISVFCPQLALLTLNVYALDFALRATPSMNASQVDPATRRRQEVMIRRYTRALQLYPIDSEFGDEGWMFRLRKPIQ